MDQVTPLLQNDLAVLLPVLLLGVRAVFAYFKKQPNLPTIPFWIVPAALFVLAEGLAFSNGRLHQGGAESLAGVWWVQGLLFAIGLVIGDQLAESVYTSGATPKEG